LQVTAGPDRPERPVRDIERDHLRRLVGGALGKSWRKRLRVGAFVGGPSSLGLARPPGPDGDRLCPISDPALLEELLEMGPDSPVRDPQPVSNFLIGQASG